MAEVIFISGNKPRSGKGTVGNFAKEYLQSKGYTVEVMEFKDKLFEISSDILGINVEDFLYLYDRKVSSLTYVEGLEIANGNFYLPSAEWVKDYKMYEVCGKWYSKREWLIHVSENIIKPHTDNKYFGKCLTDRIDCQDFVIITDSGFVDEALPVIDKVDNGCCMVIQLFRENGSDIKDSRKMLTPEDFKPHLRPYFTSIYNEGSLLSLKVTTEKEIQKWLNENQ